MMTLSRDIVDAKTKIIAWEHKLSFTSSTLEVTTEDLQGLAIDIDKTNQLLCSF